MPALPVDGAAMLCIECDEACDDLRWCEAHLQRRALVRDLAIGLASTGRPVRRDGVFVCPVLELWIGGFWRRPSSVVIDGDRITVEYDGHQIKYDPMNLSAGTVPLHRVVYP